MRFRHLIPSWCFERISRYARSIHRGQEASRLARESGLDKVERADMELVQTLLSVRASLKTMPTILLDAGAHKGDFSKYAAKMLHCRRVECFEPDADLLPELSSTLQGLEFNIHQVALSNRHESAVLFLHPGRGMNSLLQADNQILTKKFPGHDHTQIARRTIQTATMDSLLPKDRFQTCDRFFLKIDTQGTEMDVLQGAEETLKQTVGCLVEYMFCTPYIQSHSFSSLVRFMDSKHFECCGALEIKRRPTGEVSGVDFLFVPKGVGV